MGVGHWRVQVWVGIWTPAGSPMQITKQASMYYVKVNICTCLLPPTGATSVVEGLMLVSAHCGGN